MLNFSDYIVCDFETTGLGDGKQPVELAAVVIDARKLVIKEQGIFTSLCSIIPDEEVEEYGLDVTAKRALEVNGLSFADLKNAPSPKVMMEQFVNFVQYHNPSKNKYQAPIFCAHNKKFDWELMQNLQYGLHKGKVIMPNKLMPKSKIAKMTEKEAKDYIKDLKPLKEPWKFCEKEIFNPMYSVCTVQTALERFENTKTPHKLSQVVLGEYCGFDMSNAHGALFDVLLTAEMFIRHLRVQRQVSPDIDYRTNGETVLPIKEIMKQKGRVLSKEQ